MESAATLGRKCWAFAYLRQIWEKGGIKVALETATVAHGMDLSAFVAAWDGATRLTMPLCSRMMANCFVNESFSISRNGTCPVRASASSTAAELWSEHESSRPIATHQFSTCYVTVLDLSLN